MRLFCECSRQLMIRHDIKLDVLSNFTYIDGRITITKHEVTGTKGLKPFFDESEIKSAYCRSCRINVEFSEALHRCDNCGNHVTLDDIKTIGDTIMICPRCIKGIENFEIFKIFGQRGPSQRTRDKRVENAVASAVEAMPELPEEVVGMLSGDDPAFNPINDSIANVEISPNPTWDFVNNTSSTTGGTNDV